MINQPNTITRQVERLWSPETVKRVLLIWIGALILMLIQSETRFGVSTTATRILIPSVIVGNLIAYFLLHRGRERAGLTLFCLTTWLGITLVITINTGLDIPVWVIYLPLIIVVGLFLDTQLNTLLILLTLIVIPLLTWGQLANIIPIQPASAFRPHQLGAFICTIILVVSLITRLARNRSIASFSEIRAKQQAVEDSERRFRVMIDHSADAIVVIGEGGRVIQTNKQVEQWLGIKPETFYDIHLTKKPLHFTKIMEQMVDNQPYIFRTEYVRTDESTHPIEVQIVKIEWEDEAVLMGTARDVASQEATQLALLETVEEKELLLREVHHRVKNNLQIIISMLRMQSRQVTDPAMLEANQELQARVSAMSLIHQQLYRTSDLAQVEFSRYLYTLVKDIERIYKNDHIAFEFDLERVYLTVDNTLTSGLIVNELITNALKHAFGEGESGRVWCRLRRDEGVVMLTVSNDGRPLPDQEQSATKQTMGMHLLTLLTRQLGGTLTTTSDEQGVHFTLTFDSDS